MAILKKDLTALRKDFKVLEKKMEKLLKAFETGSKPKRAAKAKPVKVAALKKIEEVAKEHSKEDVNKLFEICKKYDFYLPGASNIRKNLLNTLLNRYRTNYRTSYTKKAPAKKKVRQVTATDQVLKIINRSKKGVDVPTLMKKTGFNDKKVRNIVFRAAKEGRIKKSGRGIYRGIYVSK